MSASLNASQSFHPAVLSFRLTYTHAHTHAWAGNEKINAPVTRADSKMISPRSDRIRRRVRAIYVVARGNFRTCLLE